VTRIELLLELDPLPTLLWTEGSDDVRVGEIIWIDGYVGCP